MAEDDDVENVQDVNDVHPALPLQTPRPLLTPSITLGTPQPKVTDRVDDIAVESQPSTLKVQGLPI